MSPRRQDRLRALGRLNVCALFLYFLGVLLVDFHQVVIGIPDCLQKFIKLGMNSLSIAMLSALDEERHSPSRKRGERMPLQSIAEHQPARRIGQETMNAAGRDVATPILVSQPLRSAEDISANVSLYKPFHDRWACDNAPLPTAGLWNLSTHCGLARTRTERKNGGLK